MNKIITLTVNPAVDKSTTVKGICPTQKLRCEKPIYEAGGGGINVSKVIKELGGDSQCIFLAGGAKGIHLKILLEQQKVSHNVIPIREWTRENLAVTDTFNNQQYRFGMPGPYVYKDEWQATLKLVEEKLTLGDYLVASGSLSPGMPLDFYARISEVVSRVKAKLILDTSGEALRLAAIKGAYLIKPNLGELANLCGVSSISPLELKDMAFRCLQKYPIEMLVVSLGAKGALLVTRDKTIRYPSPAVHEQSTIGAGDSMVAGLVQQFFKGETLEEALAYGIACGSAATISPGTQLCKKKDVDELFNCILEPHLK